MIFSIFPKIQNFLKIFGEIQKPFWTQIEHIFLQIFTFYIFVLVGGGRKKSLMMVFKVSVFWVSMLCESLSHLPFIQIKDKGKK